MKLMNDLMSYTRGITKYPELIDAGSYRLSTDHITENFKISVEILDEDKVIETIKVDLIELSKLR